MRFFTKTLAVVSAVLLLSGCDAMNGSGSADGSGSATPGTQSDLSQNVGDRVFFDYNSSSLTSEGQATLTKQAAWLKQYSSINVTVEGHADERGTREFNIALGERRASVAKRFLTSQGIASSRVSTISYGKERPAVIGSDDASWGQNRRSVTVVSNQ